MTEANAKKTLIGEVCYELLDEDAMLLKTTSVSGCPTVKAFQSLFGSLLWATRCTRPDVAFAVHKATRQTHAPRMHYWKLSNRITWYLNGTTALKLNMAPARTSSDALELAAFSDADFAADKADRKSLTGRVVTSTAWWCLGPRIGKTACLYRPWMPNSSLRVTSRARSSAYGIC